MLTAKEIKKRQQYIGGSDQGVIMGIDPFRDDFTMMMEKVKGYTPEINENKFMIAGNMLEKVCIAYCEMVNGFKIEEQQGHYTHPELPYLKSRIDGRAETEDAIFLVEAKTQYSVNLKKWQSGPYGVRSSYYYQGIFNAGNMNNAELYKYFTRQQHLKRYLDKYKHKLPKIKQKALRAKIEYNRLAHEVMLSRIEKKQIKPLIVIYPVLFLNMTDYRKIMSLHNNGLTGEWEELFAVYLSDKQLDATPKEVQKQVKRLERKKYKITESLIKALIFENKMLKLMQKFKKKYYEVKFDLPNNEYENLVAANRAWWERYKVKEEVPLPSSKSYKMITELSPDVKKGKILTAGDDIERYIKAKLVMNYKRKAARSEKNRLIKDHPLLSNLIKEIDKFDEDIKSIDAILKFAMGDAEQMITEKYEAKLVPVERLTLDFDTMQLEHPDIVNKYLVKKVDNNRLYVNQLDITEELETEEDD